jgi:CotH protein
MRTVLRLLLSVFAAILVSHPAAANASAPNYQGLWWNAPAESESGWGISFAHQGDAIFAAWFTYDAAGNGLWLVMVANRTGESTYAGDVLETSGPRFGTVLFDPARVSRQVVGAGSLTFRDADNGIFSFDVKGVQRTKLITRQVFGPVPTCSYEPVPELANADNYTDLWWAAGGHESGWGIDLAHEGDAIFATWATYDASGAPRWLVVTAPRVAAGVYSGKLIRATGPSFGTQPFDSARIAFAEVGIATFTFAHGNAATFAYTLDGLSGTKAITRQIFAPPAGTRCRKAASPTIQGRVFEGAPVQALVCADVDGNGRCDPNEASANTDAIGAYALAAPAGYRGALVAEVAGGKYRMASPSPEYSANISPYTTLVQLTRERHFTLAEAMVRNELGLPPRFVLNLDAAAADGTLAQAVAHSLVAALEATASTDYGAADALGRVIEVLPPALTDMPQLRIATKDAAPVLSKEIYLDATYTLTNPAASTPTFTLNGKIRGRGNYTWTLPKKPFKVQLANDGAYAAVPDLLGMKKNRNWALLADYSDRTLMRNQLMFTLGNSPLFSDGLKWTPSGVHVEVWLNGEYLGVYLLSEDVRLDAARLNIRKMASADVDGGYLAEVDWPLDCYNDGTLSLQHVTPQGVHVCIKTPDEESATPAQLTYIKALIDAAERDIYENAGIDRINPVSFADWYLLQELYRNYDAPFYSSDYLWKDTAAAAVPADRLLNMGPLWDFDIAAGNLLVADAWLPQGCWVTRIRDDMPNWYAKVFDNRAMLDLTLARWKDKRPALEKLVTSSIAAFARRLGEAQQRNFGRWPVLEDRTYEQHVAFLRNYLVQRMTWLDEAYESPSAFELMCK